MSRSGAVGSAPFSPASSALGAVRNGADLFHQRALLAPVFGESMLDADTRWSFG
jgi:hypothetical protein